MFRIEDKLVPCAFTERTYSHHGRIETWISVRKCFLVILLLKPEVPSRQPERDDRENLWPKGDTALRHLDGQYAAAEQHRNSPVSAPETLAMASARKKVLVNGPCGKIPAGFLLRGRLNAS